MSDPKRKMKPAMMVMVVVVVMLTGCANVPPAIRQAPPGDVRISQVRVEPGRYVGTPVRWGGTIASVKNGETDTTLEIVQNELGWGGEPKLYAASSGRFLVRVNGFLDPAIYSKGREVTVAGVYSGQEEGLIGNSRYVYPVVLADTVHLWRFEDGYYPGYHFGYGIGVGSGFHHGFRFGFGAYSF